MLPTFFVALALAGAPVDFTGTWVLDLAASDSVDALLAETGASWLERQAAGTMPVTQVISQSPATITIMVDSSLIDRTETLSFTGPQSSTSRTGDAVVTRTSWDGAVLVTTAVMTTPTGEVRELRIRRQLSDGGRTLRQELALQKPGAKPIKAERVFRRG